VAAAATLAVANRRQFTRVVPTDQDFDKDYAGKQRSNVKHIHWLLSYDVWLPSTHYVGCYQNMMLGAIRHNIGYYHMMFGCNLNIILGVIRI
jgi:hypothetical protein